MAEYEGDAAALTVIERHHMHYCRCYCNHVDYDGRACLL